MDSSIYLIMYNPVCYTHIRLTISLCQEIKCSSITLSRLYRSHVRHCIGCHPIIIWMFQEFSSISFRGYQQNSSYSNTTLTSLLQYHIKRIYKILFTKIICFPTILIRYISYLLRKMHKIIYRNINRSTTNS